MEYKKGYVYELMDKGGPTDVMEPYFMEAAEEMMRARTLCAKANAALPDDPAAFLPVLDALISDCLLRLKHSQESFVRGWAILDCETLTGGLYALGCYARMSVFESDFRAFAEQLTAYLYTRDDFSAFLSYALSAEEDAQ